MGITFVLTPHIFWISQARSWYFSSFSSSFVLTLPPSGIATSIICQLFSFLSMISRSGLDPNLKFMVCLYTTTSCNPHFEVLCTSYRLLQLCCHVSFYILFVPILDIHLQYGRWSRCFVSTFYIWDRSVSCQLLLLHNVCSYCLILCCNNKRLFLRLRFPSFNQAYVSSFLWSWSLCLANCLYIISIMLFTWL